jgi:predicted kinase
MPKVHLIEGPVGAGKSTYSSTLALRTNGVHIALDEWFAELFSPDRPTGDFVPWYTSRKERLLTLIWSHSRRLLASGTDVILELGLIQRQSRVAFGRQIQDEGFALVVHVLDAPLEVRRERVRRRNADKGSTFAMVVPDEMMPIVESAAPVSLGGLAQQIRRSSNFRFDWQWFSLDAVPAASPSEVRRILDKLVSEPACHRFLEESFSDLYDPAFKIEPIHKHCRVVDITHEFDGILARAATDRLGAYSRELVDAPASELMAVRRLFWSCLPLQRLQLATWRGGELSGL